MTRDIAIHIVIALSIQVIVVALFLRPFGFEAGAWAGALTGATAFASREIAQAPYKHPPRINWPEAYWPAVACAIVAVLVSLAARLIQ